MIFIRLSIWFLFLTFFCSSIFANEENRKEWNRAVKEKILKMNEAQEETESIPYLQKFVEKNPADLTVKLWYARALFYRKDLEIPGYAEDIFLGWKNLRRLKEIIFSRQKRSRKFWNIFPKRLREIPI